MDAGTDHPWLVLHRAALRVACNLGHEATEITLDRPASEVLLTSADPTVTERTVHLPADSFAILRVAPQR